MSGPQSNSPVDSASPLDGVGGAGRSPRAATYNRVAAGLSVAWIALVGVLFLIGAAGNGTGERSLIIAMTLALPVGMIWIAAAALRSARILREESDRLRAVATQLYHAQIEAAHRGAVSPSSDVGRKLDELAAATRQLAARSQSASSDAKATDGPQVSVQNAAPVSMPDGATAAPSADAGAQSGLELQPPEDANTSEISAEDFIRALHFPETAEDGVGFAALRKALRDRKAAQLIQASQDVLTLLSQEGIYMDDLNPDMARPEIWRKFAQGIRGREIADLGGLRDPETLEVVGQRMKQDPIFRDAAHHFLRLFDRMFTAFEPSASDAEITALAQTRSACAFMIVGRAAGMFS